MAESGKSEPRIVVKTPTLSVLAETRAGVLLARIGGRLDGQNVPIFRQALESLAIDEYQLCILDMEELTYIASDGLRVLLGLRRVLSEGSCMMALCSLPSNVAAIFEISGFARVFPIYSTVEAATAAGRD